MEDLKSKKKKTICSTFTIHFKTAATCFGTIWRMKSTQIPLFRRTQCAMVRKVEYTRQ